MFPATHAAVNTSVKNQQTKPDQNGNGFLVVTQSHSGAATSQQVAKTNNHRQSKRKTIIANPMTMFIKNAKKGIAAATTA